MYQKFRDATIDSERLKYIYALGNNFSKQKVDSITLIFMTNEFQRSLILFKNFYNVTSFFYWKVHFLYENTWKIGPHKNLLNSALA